jgi:hypothetical protein
MARQAGFDVVVDPRAASSPLLPKLPFVRLFPDTPGRLPPKAWAFYNATRALGSANALMFFLFALLALAASLVVPWLSNRDQDSFSWPFFAVALALTLASGWICWKSIAKLRHLTRHLLVVPARVIRKGVAVPSQDVSLFFEFQLFGNRQTVELAAPSDQAKRVRDGEDTYLAVDPSCVPVVCFFVPRMCEKVYLAAAIEAPPPATPPAPVPILPVEATPAEADPAMMAPHAGGTALGRVLTATFTYSSDEEAELTMTVVADSTEQPASSIRRTFSEIVTFAVFVALAAFVTGVGMLAKEAGSALGRPLQGSLPAAVGGTAVFLAGILVVRFGNRLRRGPLRPPEPVLFWSDEREVVLTSAGIETRWEWTAFDRLVETPHVLVLRGGTKWACGVPTRAFQNEEERLALLDRIRRHLHKGTDGKRE